MIWAYRRKKGVFPDAPNHVMVAAIEEEALYDFHDQLNDEREVIDQWGRPYVYQYPGVIFDSFF